MGNDLARRVRENTGTVEKADREAGAPTLAQRIQQMQSQFQLAMPKGAEAVQLVRDALTCLRTTPKLAECEPASVLGGLMTCAQLGLRPGVPGLGHAWLLPFWDSRLVWLDEKGRQRTGGQRAQLIIGYQGYRELAQRSGQIATVIGRAVHENDYFELEYGLADNLVHRPKLDGSRGPAVGYYAIVKYAAGGYAFWHMSRSEIEEHRDRYAMARNKKGEIVGPWRDNFDEMAVKTAFLRLAKWMPKSTELASAIEADGTVRIDVTPDPDAMLYGERPNVVDEDPPAALPASAERPEPEPAPNVAEAASEPAPQSAEPAAPAIPRSWMARIHASLSDCGVAEADRHATLGAITRRPIGSANDLTPDEAKSVIDVLARCAQNSDPAMALDVALAEIREGA